MNIFQRIKLYFTGPAPSIVDDDLWVSFSEKIRQGSHRPVEIDIPYDRLTEDDLYQLKTDGLIEFHTQMAEETDVQPPPIVGYRIYATHEMLAKWDVEALKRLEITGTFAAPKFRSWIW